jgi:hypothetical protein
MTTLEETTEYWTMAYSYVPECKTKFEEARTLT